MITVRDALANQLRIEAQRCIAECEFQCERLQIIGDGADAVKRLISITKQLAELTK